MLVGKLEPLDVAKKVLRPSTLEVVCRHPYTTYGWKILDRWAMNDPVRLKNLEIESEFLLLSKLLEQQTTETQVLTNQSALERLATGETEAEILASEHVNTEL
ncbi:hypothetical protein R77560_04606 [Ralstonia thomasii]|uniref:Uncharacterized protein n=1 Tax=Ralstonia thomasii TaxID=3058596 RepID=A0AAD2BUE7_9RALS|nr:hypothetical protein [Ralstonia sp. LMG 18095]CAJ0807654.1 hypothetical protein R77560_04606 [Ralstonia sp. LMG 18095]